MKIDTGNKQPPVTSIPKGVYPITEVEEEIEAPTGVYVFHKILNIMDIATMV